MPEHYHKKQKKQPWPRKSQTGSRSGTARGTRQWVPHPQKKGWQINIMTMDERKIKRKK